MPALVDQPNVLAVRLHWAASLDTNIQSKLHFKWSGTAPSNATCSTLASDIRAFAVTRFQGLIDSDHTIGEVDVTDLTSAIAGNGAATGSTAGSRAGAFLPAGVAVLTSYKIGRRYRGGKPRTYWPFGVGGDMQNNSTWQTTFMDAVRTAVNGFVADTSGLTVAGCSVGAHCNVSYYEGFVSSQNPVTLRWRNIPLPRTVAIAPDDITAISVDTKPASQRRRNLQTA